ncbi:MAG TPA: hypothetical protein PLM75_07615, partial [bacterium]|nr:hypothetical protein [bacterium]
MINLKKSLFCGVILLLIFSVNIINANQQKSKSQILLDMAKQYYDSGKYSEAAELLQKAFEEEPTNDRILNLLVDSIVKRDTIGKSKLSEPSRQPASTTAVMPSQNANVNVNPLTELKAQGEKIRSEVISGVNIQQQLPSQSPQPQQQNAALPAIKPQLIIPASQEVRIAQNQNVAEDISYFAQPQSLNADNYKTFGLPQTKAPRSVSKIEVLFFQDTTQIIIDADENCNYVIERLREPWPMYVIDVIDATNYLPRGKRFELNKGIVRRIRHSQYREVPVKTTRVVVDLANWNTNISITRVKNKIVVDIANAINIAQPPLRNTGQIVAQNIDLGLPLEKFDIEVVSYDPAQQMGLVNKQPIVVKLLKEGKPAANERIIFESITELAGFKTDAGIYNLTELITDDFGIAKVLNFIVRPVLGENLIKIYPLKDNSVVKIISIGSVPGKPHKIVKVSGDNQKLNINNPNNEPFVVKVLDKDDNPVGEGVPVIFSTINRDCKIDVNLDNPYDNEVVTYTDSNSIARCDRFFVGMESGMKILKASILIDEPAKLPTKLVVTSTASLSEAVETFIKGLDLKTNNDISVMIYETADTLNLNALRDDVYVSLKQSGKVEIMPHLNTLYVSDENIYFTDVPVKLLNYANFNIISKTLRTVNFTVNVAPRLVTINFKGAELVDVIRTLAELGDWNISYAEEDVANKQVNLHLIDVPAIVALDTILDMNDLTRVQSGNLMKIMQKAKSIQSPLPIKSDYNEDFGIGDNFITQIVQLMNVDGLRMLDTIRELVSPNGRITYEQNTNSFIIIDSKSNVRKLLQIIKAFDISAKSGREYLKIYKLTFAEAEAVKNLLEGLMTKNREEIAAAARKEKSSTKKTTTTKKT